MLGHDLRLIDPANGGPLDPAIARHLALLDAWRRRTPAEQRLALAGDDPAFMPANEPARGRVRLGLFGPCLCLGGAEAWQLALAGAVDPASVVWRGMAVTSGRRWVVPAMYDATTRVMPVGLGLGAARTLAAAVDVILSWSILDYRELFAGLPRPPRVVLACHLPGDRLWPDADSRLLAQVDRLVAVSELAIDSLPAEHRGRVEVIWNAVDADRLVASRPPAATRAAWGVPPGARVAGYLGRLEPEKDPAAMLRLARELPPPWHVVLVGEGGQRAQLEAEVDHLGLDRVRLVGGTAGVGDALAAFDALVVPSRFESFGLTMAEGFAAGVPVIATRSGLAKLVPGLVREVGFVSSGAELARAVRLDHDLDRPATLARVDRARRFARDRLDLARFGRDWTRLVLDLAAERPPSTREEGSCRPVSPRA